MIYLCAFIVIFGIFLTYVGMFNKESSFGSSLSGLIGSILGVSIVLGGLLGAVLTWFGCGMMPIVLSIVIPPIILTSLFWFGLTSPL